MKDKNSHGGKRKGAGRKPSLDKKLAIVVYIESSKIKSLGGCEKTKQLIYEHLSECLGGNNNMELLFLFAGYIHRIGAQFDNSEISDVVDSFIKQKL